MALVGVRQATARSQRRRGSGPVSAGPAVNFLLSGAGSFVRGRMPEMQTAATDRCGASILAEEADRAEADCAAVSRAAGAGADRQSDCSASSFTSLP
jgi:hypothetical protein